MNRTSNTIGARGWDWAYLALLLLIASSIVLFWSSEFPLQLWDESRIANNAIEMMYSGRWLTLTYNGVPDHWNAKPPLLIWAIVGLMHIGVPKLLAVRVPSALAVLGTVFLVWAACRNARRDRLSGPLAGAILIGSTFFTGFHVGRTGDFDAALSFFILAYVLAFWRALEQPAGRWTGWFAVACASFVLAVLDKGIAGAFGLPGIAVFAVSTGRIRQIATDIRAWILLLTAGALVAAYYIAREHDDPGYLAAVWSNELGGRFVTAVEHHTGDMFLYWRVLAQGFQPGLMLLPAALVTARRPGLPHRGLAALCLCCGLGIILLTGTARTKFFWYVAPVVPLFAIAAAMGVADALREIHRIVARRLATVALAGVLMLGIAYSLYKNRVPELFSDDILGQYKYGVLLDDLHDRSDIRYIFVIDAGFENTAGFLFYNPILKFYATVAADHGLRVDPVVPGAILPRGAYIATCDRSLRPTLGATYRAAMQPRNAWCDVGVVGSD